MPICTVERKRFGDSASLRAARAPLSPASARSLRRALREETIAVSDMARRPLRRARTTMTAICSATPLMRSPCTRGGMVPNPSSLCTQVTLLWSSGAAPGGDVDLGLRPGGRGTGVARDQQAVDLPGYVAL